MGSKTHSPCFVSMATVTMTFALLTTLLMTSKASTILRADGSKDAYALINRVFGGKAVEMPDCTHKVKHITQQMDNELRRPVFLFHSHVLRDGDTCAMKDRQRTEIKTNSAHLQGLYGDRVSHSWNFRLDSSFKPSKSFSHIHQLKAVGGQNSGSPIITLTPRKGSPSMMQVIHVDGNGQRTRLASVNLDNFLGNWVHVKEDVFYHQSKGRIALKLTRLADGKDLLSFQREGLDLWREGAQFVRPKWGLYRSLTDRSSLRDEIVKFDTFCVGTQSDPCH